MALQIHTFIKDASGWYINLPQFIEKGGTKEELAMVEGADTMLDIMADGKNAVTISLDTESFEGADMVELTEKCDPTIGGGYYLLKSWEGRRVMQTMWLCAVTESVFDYLPEKIFIRRFH